MPKLGEFIGALLSDAVQARVQADLEAVRVAEAYSSDDLLKHLPVPRFRLPDITVEMPVLVSAVEGLPTEGSGASPAGPTSGELTKAVRAGLKQSRIRLARAESDLVSAAVIHRAEERFAAGPRVLLSSSAVATELAATAVDAVRLAVRRDPRPEQLEELRAATRSSLATVLAARVADSPHLQVAVTSGEIKSHADTESVVRIRLTITEDAYEVINRDDGQGYSLTPE
jgi:hypothetical protein